VAGFVLLPDLNSEAFSYFLIVATFFNAAMLILNLLPLPTIGGHPTDGHVLWVLARQGQKLWSR
jgi:hypothetical protein